MTNKSVHIKSFGCQMNKLDTALVKSALKEAGYELTDTEAAADAVLINTCSVRAKAEQKVLSTLGNLKTIKESKPELIVGVIGCMAQRMGQDLLDRDEVDIVCGPAQIAQLPELLKEACVKHEKTLAVTEKIRTAPPENPQLEDFESIHDSDDKAIPNQAFVRAMRGCNNFCSYCIVPYVRGPEISRPPAAIIEQIKRLAGDGVKLVTLLGQTVNSYEYKAGEKTWSLADLLEKTSEIDGIEWIRFVTSYPHEKYFKDICQSIATLEKVCNYLHIPAQSGSDRILKAMNRRYTADHYLNLLSVARDIVPNIAIAGDFIVGFPGETDEDFADTVKLVEKAKYKNAFIFKYSPRPGTGADNKLQDSVPVSVKKKRNNELLAVQESISEQLSDRFMERQVKVLVEGLSKKPHLNRAENDNNPQLIARTADDWIVVFNGPLSLTGDFAKVKITRTAPLTLFGQLV